MNITLGNLIVMESSRTAQYLKFHGGITREETNNLLQPREDGLFLVINAPRFPGDYVLCVCFQTNVYYYRVKDMNNQLTIDDEEYFKDLEQLIQHYEKDALVTTD